jgi:hypothetical protein
VSQQKVTFRISPAAAPYVGADKPLQDRLKAASGEVALPPMDQVLLVYYLCLDPDPAVKKAAVATLRRLDPVLLREVLTNPLLPSRVLDALVQLHFQKPELVPLFATHPMLSEKAAAFLSERGLLPLAATDQPDKQPEPDPLPDAEPPVAPGDEGESEADEEGEVDETTEEFQSKFQLAQGLGVGDKIKMALTGDKEWRSILIKDSNKLVSGSVIKNPRITEGEVLMIAKSAVQNDEIMRVICANKDWIKNATIRSALVWNHKTPLPAALRFVSTLPEKELSRLAKSKNVSSVVAGQARRILLSKKDGR